MAGNDRRAAGRLARRRWRGLAGAFVVGLLLIAAETYAAWHAVDLDAHQSDDACKICLAVSGFSAANVGAIAAPVDVAPALCCTAQTGTHFTPRHVLPQTARGPPTLS